MQRNRCHCRHVACQQGMKWTGESRGGSYAIQSAHSALPRSFARLLCCRLAMTLVPACLSHSSASCAACATAPQHRYAFWRCTPTRSRVALVRATVTGSHDGSSSGSDDVSLSARLLGAAAVAASLSSAAAHAAAQADVATPAATAVSEQADAAAAAAGAAAAAAASFTPGPVEVGWEIWVGFVAGVVPFIIATVEFRCAKGLACRPWVQVSGASVQRVATAPATLVSIGNTSALGRSSGRTPRPLALPPQQAHHHPAALPLLQGQRAGAARALPAQVPCEGAGVGWGRHVGWLACLGLKSVQPQRNLRHRRWMLATGAPWRRARRADARSRAHCLVFAHTAWLHCPAQHHCAHCHCQPLPMFPLLPAGVRRPAALDGLEAVFLLHRHPRQRRPAAAAAGADLCLLPSAAPAPPGSAATGRQAAAGGRGAAGATWAAGGGACGDQRAAS